MVTILTDAYKSVEVASKGKVVRIDEGNIINFAVETGESITGRVTKISGKGDKTKIQIIPTGEQKEEIWSVLLMVEDSLVVVNENEEDEE